MASLSPPSYAAERALPDVYITSAKIENDYVVIGEDAVINITVACSGDAAANINVTVYLDSNTTFIHGNPFLNVSLSEGEKRSITAVWNTTNVAPGEHKIIIVADANNSINESNENNNEYVLNVNAYSARLPDLTVSSDDIDMPDEAFEGDDVSITVRIWNIGIAIARDVNVSAYNAETHQALASFMTIPEIPANESRNTTFIWDTSGITPGQYTVLIAVDYVGDGIKELNESNNNATAGILIKERYINVSVSNVSMSPELPRLGDVITFSVEFKNDGNKPAEDYSVKYYLDERLIGVKFLDIPPSERINDTTAVNTTDYTEGNHTLSIAHGEDNRTYEYNFTLLPTLKPDLTFLSVRYTPEDAYIGDTIKFEIEVGNVGNASANDVEVMAYADMMPDPIAHITIDYMPVGARENITFMWNTSIYGEGVHRIRIIIDPLNKIPEENALNNINTTTIYLSGMPNLQFEKVEHPDNWTSNSTLKITIVVKNNGTGGSKCETSVEIYAGDEIISNKILAPLVAGGTQEYTISWTPTSPGVQKFKCIIDPKNNVSESNESDNEMEFSINIAEEKEPLDISVDNVTVSPPVIYEDTVIEVKVIVSNIGGKEVEMVSVIVYLQAEGKNEVLVDSQSIDSLKPEESKALFFYINAGDYYPNRYSLIVEARAPAGVDEQNLSNNRHVTRIEILKKQPLRPDLKILSITFNPKRDRIKEGEGVEISVKALNTGGGASNIVVQMYVDGNIVKTQKIAYLGRDEPVDIIFNERFNEGNHTVTIKMTHPDTGITVRESASIEVMKKPTMRIEIAGIGVLFFVIFMSAFGVYRLFLTSPARKYRVRLMPYEEE